MGIVLRLFAIVCGLIAIFFLPVMLRRESSDAQTGALIAFLFFALLTWLLFRAGNRWNTNHQLVADNSASKSKQTGYPDRVRPNPRDIRHQSQSNLSQPEHSLSEIDRLVAGRVDKWPSRRRRPERPDEASMLPSQKTKANDSLKGMRFGLTYEDAFGNESDRVVRIISIESRNNTDYLVAHCELREATRTFRLDRIVEAIDLSTGEVIENPIVFFKPIVEMASGSKYSREESDDGKQSSKLIETFGDELRLLCMVARADGHFGEDEREIILKYALLRSIDEREFATPATMQAIKHWVKVQDPQPDQVQEIVRNVAKSGLAQLGFLWSIATAVANADGEWKKPEVRVVGLIKDAVEWERKRLES